jgi:serine protease AprX
MVFDGDSTMKKILIVLLIGVVFIPFLGRQQSAVASMDANTIVNTGTVQIDPVLQAAIDSAQSGDMVSVILTLRQQADLTKVHGATRAERLQVVIQALQGTANATQGRLIGLLNSYHNQGLVDSFTPLWVFNGFSVKATAEVIQALAQDPDVFAITTDDIHIVPAWGTPESNITLVNAPLLWSQGYTGQGVVVASMDSGVDAAHPDLSSRWRGGSNSWYDPYGQHSTPVDLSGHGTWTTGIMVGGDVGGTSIGVAPGAQWIAVKIFNDQGGSTATAIHLGFQWLLDPDGNPNTADAPQVVNNSWTYANPGCYLDFEPDLESLRAAGILPVFAAGNGGPYSNTSYSPSNNPAAFAVGAVDNNDQIYAYSSRGPSTCGGSTGPFPEIVAPGVNVRTTYLFGLYTNETGTSLAAPHVAGGLALLLSAYPNLDSGMQEQALIQSAVDLGASGADDVFGFGRLDLLSALNWASTAPTSTPMPTATSTPVPTATPTSVPDVNLALNQPVTVSSYQDIAHSGSAADDGDLNTKWQTEKVRGKNKSTSEWITVDLGSSQNVSQVTLDWDTYFATAYSLQVSLDQNNWSDVGNTSSGNGGQETITFDTVQARYIRLYTSAWNDNSYRNWLNELEVYANAASSAPASIPTSTPTATPTATATATLDTGNRIHVGDLDDSSISNGSRWNAVVTILVHDTADMPLEGVSVNGDWSNGVKGSGSCTTDADGICSISHNNLKNNVSSVSFSISNLSNSNGWSYDALANHDPDGDSDGTSITLLKP